MAPARGETAPATHVPERCGQRSYDADNQPGLDVHQLTFHIRHTGGNRVREHGKQREVPRAIRSDAPNSIDNAGTASAPPPIPATRPKCR